MGSLSTVPAQVISGLSLPVWCSRMDPSWPATSKYGSSKGQNAREVQAALLSISPRNTRGLRNSFRLDFFTRLAVPGPVVRGGPVQHGAPVRPNEEPRPVIRVDGEGERGEVSTVRQQRGQAHSLRVEGWFNS